MANLLEDGYDFTDPYTGERPRARSAQEFTPPGGGGFGDRLTNPLVMFGLGLASGKTPQEGIGNAAKFGLQGQQYQNERQSQGALYQAALKMGLAPQQAMAFALNPQAANMLEHNKLEQQKLNRPMIIPYGAGALDPNTRQPISVPNGMQEEARAIADEVKDGRQPPDLKQAPYRLKGAVAGELAKDKFDLSNAQVQWTRAQKQIQALNGPQMTRFQGLAISVDKTIDEVRQLGKEMELGNIPIKNYIELQAYIQTQGNTPNGQLATRYITAINTLKEEFANLAQGGYAPTESVWHLANKQLNENYGMKQMDASLNEIQRLIRYRINAIPNINTMGSTAPNPYIPNSGGQQLPPPPTAPAQAAPQAPETKTIGGKTYFKQNGQWFEQ